MAAKLRQKFARLISQRRIRLSVESFAETDMPYPVMIFYINRGFA
jgi:hypothetical protein